MSAWYNFGTHGVASPYDCHSVYGLHGNLRWTLWCRNDGERDWADVLRCHSRAGRSACGHVYICANVVKTPTQRLDVGVLFEHY